MSHLLAPQGLATNLSLTGTRCLKSWLKSLIIHEPLVALPQNVRVLKGYLSLDLETTFKPIQFVPLLCLFHATPSSLISCKNSITLHLLNAGKKSLKPKFWKQFQCPTLQDWKD